MKPNPKLGEIIRKYRNIKGLSQEELGNKLDLSGQTIGSLERSKRGGNTETIHKLITFLKIPLDEILPYLHNSIQDTIKLLCSKPNDDTEAVIMPASGMIPVYDAAVLIEEWNHTMPVPNTIHAETFISSTVTDAPNQFYVRLTSDAMIADGIKPGDCVLVDPDAPVSVGDVVICKTVKELMIRRYYINHTDMIDLIASNPQYPPVHIKPDQPHYIYKVRATLRIIE